jgi:hypothetical protein
MAIETQRTCRRFIPPVWWFGSAVACAVGAAGLLAGCGRGTSLVEVRGTVYVGDQPVQKGTGHVTFHPDAQKGNKSLEEAVGAIQPDGTYVLETRGTRGVAPGWYKVGVSVSEVLDPNNPYVTKWLMPNPEKYRDWNKSGISIEVVEKPAEGQYDIRLPPLTSP